MKNFLTKIFITSFIFSVSILGLHIIWQYASKKIYSTNESKSIFIWGDSQMYYGLDASLISGQMKRHVISSARKSAGVYDFLTCEKIISSKSICLISFPEIGFLRNPSLEYNRTRLDIECLYKMWLAGCPYQECLRIFSLNRKPTHHNIYYSNHELYPYTDTILPFSYHTITNIYSSRKYKEWLQWKINAYSLGIQRLYKSRSQLILIQFPAIKPIEQIIQKIEYKNYSDSQKNILIEKYSMKYDTIVLTNDSILMHDNVHMNEVGAKRLTNRISNILKKDSTNNYFIKVIIE